MPHRFFVACIITVAAIALGGFGFAETAEAATKYAVNAGGNWSADATWSTVSAKDASRVANTTAPTAADDVVLDDYSGNVTIATAAACRSIDMTANGNYGGVLNHDAGITLIIGDDTAGAGNVALKFTGTTTYTIDSGTTSAISFQSSSATQQTIDFSGMNTGNVTFGATAVAGNYQLTGTWGTSAVNASQTVTLTKGTLDTNGQTVYWGRFVSTNTNIRSFVCGTSTIHIYQNGSSGEAFYFGNATNLTFSGASATIIFEAATNNGSYVTMLFGNQTGTHSIGTITINSANVPWIYFQNLSIGNFNRKASYLKLYDNLTVTGELKLEGNSSTNRLLVYTDILGTARTINVTGATVSNSQNVDFRDITFAGSPDFSGITGGSGDAGGNTGATFTTADDWYWYNSGAGTYNFSDYSHWYTATNGGGSQMASTRVVLPQDNAFFDSSSVNGTTTVDQDMPRVCKTLDFTGVDAMNFHMNNVSQTIYGSLIFSDNVTITGSAVFYRLGISIFPDAACCIATTQQHTLMSMV